MNPQQPVFDPDDTAGHASRFNGADAERDETDDTEGHGYKLRAAAVEG